MSARMRLILLSCGVLAALHFASLFLEWSYFSHFEWPGRTLGSSALGFALNLDLDWLIPVALASGLFAGAAALTAGAVLSGRWAPLPVAALLGLLAVVVTCGSFAVIEPHEKSYSQGPDVGIGCYVHVLTCLGISVLAVVAWVARRSGQAGEQRDPAVQPSSPTTTHQPPTSYHL